MELNTTFMRETLVKVLTGVPTTLQIIIITLLIAGPLAFLFAIARMEKKKVASKLRHAGYSADSVFVQSAPQPVEPYCKECAAAEHKRI